MIKKLSIMMLLMALFAPWAANAQETANVVSGGTGTNQYVPMYNFYNDYGHRSEYIIPASYFSEAGISEGAQLTSITIYRSATGSWTAKDLTIILTNTATEYYDNTSFLGKEGTTVFFSSSYPGGSNSSYTFEFDEPFEYTGESLVVHIWAGNGGTCTSGSTASTWFGYSSTTNSQALYASGSNSSTATTGTRQSFLPNTTFTYEDSGSSSCPRPTNLECTAYTSNTATLSWNETGTATNWVLEYGTTANFAGATSVNVSDTPSKSLTNLTPETKYYARVKAVCGDDNQSNWSNTCEFKPSDVQVVTIGSGETTNSYLPAYTFYNNNLSEQIYTAEEVGMAGTITSISFYNGGSEKSPEIKIYMVNTDQSEFSSTTNWLTVTQSDLVFGNATVTFTANQWTTIELDTPFEYDGSSNLGLIIDEHMQYSSGLACRVFTSTSNCAMYVYSDGTDYDAVGATYTASNRLSVKNQIKLEITPDSNYCPRPTNLTMNNITSTSAAISWNGSSDSYLVMVKESSQAEPTEYTYDFEDGTSQGWTTLKGSDGTSPNNWMHCIDYVPRDYSSGYGHNESDGFMISESYVSTENEGEGTPVYPDNYLVSPQVPLGGSINFWASNPNDNYGEEHFAVAVSMNGNTNVNSFTQVQEWTLLARAMRTGNTRTIVDGTWYEYSANLSTFTGMGYVAIHHFDCYDQWLLCIDDITINTGEESQWTTYPASASPFTINDLNPGTTYDVKVIGICEGEESNASTTINFTTEVSCPAPTGLTVSDITGHEATVSWDKIATQETGDITYNYTWVEHGGTPDWTLHGSMSAFDRWTNEMGPRAFAFDLDPETEYDFYVRRDCGEEGYSAEVMITFTTTVTCPAPTDVTVSDITGHEATVTWTGSSESYIVKYRTAAYMDGFKEEFNTNVIPSYWTKCTGKVDQVIAGTTTLSTGSGAWTATSYGLGTYNAKLNIWGTSANSWLVSPEVTLVNGASLNFDLALTDYNNSDPIEDATAQADDRFVVLIYANNAWTILREWNNSGSLYIYNNIATAGENVNINLSAYQGQTVKIAFYGESTANGGDNDLHIDNVTIGLPVAAGEWQTITTEEASVTLTGLDPETLYEVVVQGDCGEEGLSSESIPVTFTTEVSCPAPSDINVSDITGHEATVTWTGSSNSYNVMYRTAALYGISEEFNSNSVPTSWAKYSGLVDNVIAGTEALSTTTSGWNSTSYALGDYNMKVNVYGTTCKYWLVTPEVALGNGFDLNFDLALTDYGNSNPIEDATAQSDDRFIVLIYTDNAWHILREWNNSGSSYVYNTIATTGQNVSINLSAYTGKIVKIAFYCESTISGGDNDLHIDNVTIGFPVAAGEWQTVTTEEASVTLTGLDPETLYEVIIQGDCGDEGMSAESEPVTFITDVTCPAPHDLRTSDVTSNSAMLHWEGNAESYNVSYYKAYFFDSFEEDLSQWTIIKDGDDGSFEWGIENPHDNSADLNAHSGSYAAVAYSNIDVHADSWLITPQITMPTQATLKFWVMRSTYDDAQDEYEVRLSTTGNAVEDFDVVLQEKAAASSTWTEVSIDLSEYDGQPCFIAIRHDFTGGFFIMVDDFGVYGWSEDIVTTADSLLIEDLLPETEYQWHVQANCGEEDGLSQWSNIGSFTTLKACPVPFDLNVNEITANGATIAWTGFSESYNVWVGQYEVSTTNYDFEDQNISDFTTTTTDYPWTVTSNDKYSGSYSVKSGGAGVNSATSDLNLEVTVEHDATLSFWARISSESTYDKGYFSIDGVNQSGLNGISGNGSWINYTYTLEAGSHTLRWYYTKDSSVNSNDDCFYVDDITIQSSIVSSWISYSVTESPFILNDATNILPETTYMVKVKGFCGDEETEYSETITFTTLDENTKIFVIEGDWSDGDNWVPAGVPSIEQDVILRAEATVFDVAEANIITIDDAGALIIEDGGQLKTNADVEATMKKFIIGYGTDYVETNDGYYLMTLPIADPISAADAGLITEESEYDLYSWDRTATDEEWQNNHDGIDMQNGAGYLYANQDDMEMSFTATLRNSSESIVVTPAYDEVEHGGWNLYGNPFPCEAYITTDAEDMTFYRLVGNQLELIEGAIAPLEAFFVKATAAGQTFTISREAPAK